MRRATEYSHRPSLYGATTARILACLLIACFALWGCSSRSIPEDSEVPMQETTFSFDQGTYPSDIGLFPKYEISPGDVLDVLFQIRREKNERFEITLYHTLNVKFVRHPELNEIQQVLPNGEIELPYLGGVNVLGKTPKELSEELEDRYSSELRNPQIYVTVPDFDARVEQLRNDLHTSPRGLSKLVNVRPDGYASFPLVGELRVARKTISRVKDTLQEEYADVLPGMQADLFLHEHSGSAVYVIGEVQNSGRYEVAKPITALQALAMAGGHTHNAQLKNVIVFRKHENKSIARSINLTKSSNAQDESTFFYLKPEDLVYVPRTRLSTLSQVMRQVAEIALFNGWSFGISDQVDWIGPNEPDDND